MRVSAVLMSGVAVRVHTCVHAFVISSYFCCVNCENYYCNYVWCRFCVYTHVYMPCSCIRDFFVISAVLTVKITTVIMCGVVFVCTHMCVCVV